MIKQTSQKTELECIMPWKALYMDECNGKVAALPCCAGWVNTTYGNIGSATLQELWNSEGAQHIRKLIAAGRLREICNPHCSFLLSGRHGENTLRIIDGSSEFIENQRINLDEIRQRKSVLCSLPMLLRVVPSLQCNLRCTMCFQCSYDAAGLDGGTWHEIKELLPYTHEITFQGGEAAINKDFRNFLDSQSLRMHSHVLISLITNGTVLDAGLQKSLARVKLNFITVSLNAASRETYAKITGKDFFDRVLGNLKKLKELTSNHPSGKFNLRVSFVVMRSNYKELPMFLHLAEELGIEVQLLQIIGNRNNEDVFSLSDEHMAFGCVLDEASKFATGTAKEQVERIRMILNSYVC